MAYGTNAPFGLRPLQSINGGSWTEKTNEYYIYADAAGTTTYATSLFTGDPVIWNPAAAQAGTLAVYPSPNLTAADPSTAPILGVFMGCEFFDTLNRLTKSAFWPGATPVYKNSLIKAWVIDDPTVVYDVQVSTSTNDPTTAFFTPQMFGQNFVLSQGYGGNVVKNPATGSIVSGQSAFYLNTQIRTVDHTAATLSAKAFGYTLNPQNIPPAQLTLATTPFLNVRVMLNNHYFKAGTVGVVGA